MLLYLKLYYKNKISRTAKVSFITENEIVQTSVTVQAHPRHSTWKRKTEVKFA